jgi:hypothetical protein
VLQFCVSVRAPQSLPPFAAGFVTLFVRVCVPVPQDLLQAPQEDQSLVTQSDGQANVLQACVSTTVPQSFPPLAAGFVIVRDLVWVPPPQDLLQALQDDQTLVSQSVGQACALQGFDSFSNGQAVPSFNGCLVTVLVLV